MLLESYKLFVLYIQEVTVTEIKHHPELEKELLYLVNELDYQPGQLDKD